MEAFLITIVLLLSGIIYFKKNKIFFYILFFWLIIIFSFNNGGPDYNGYIEMFEKFSCENKEILFLPNSLFAKSIYYGHNFLSLTLESYTFIISIAILFIYVKIINKYSYLKNKSALILIMYMIYPAIEEIIQKRNFIASIFFLQMIIYCSENKLKKMCLFLILAIGFHSSMIIYIFVLPLLFLEIKKLKKLILFLFIMIIISMRYIKNLSYILGDSRIKYYILSSKTDFKVMLAFIISQLLFSSIVFYFSSIKNKTEKKINPKISRLENVILKMNYILLLIIPLYYYNITFFRIYRNILLFNYIYISNYIYLYPKKRNENIVNMFIIFLIGWFVIFFCQFGLGYKKLVEPIFLYNSMFKYIN
ncbi:MAG: EpsG family protein [Cetobacterium sp.]|nr:EpsG family protein [Cetobacterium sp.]